MEIRQLRYFIAVADTLSFSRAASSVYLSQSALSRQIMDLEQEVGAPLFIRSTRSVELTTAGKELQIRAKELISQWEKMIPEVRKCSETGSRALSLTIGTDPRALASPVRRQSFLNLLAKLRQEYPGIRILLRNTDYQTILQELESGIMDCALILDRDTVCASDYEWTYLGGEEMVLAFRSRNLHRDGDHAELIRNRGLILVDHEQQGLYHIIHILNDLQLEPQIRFCQSLEDMVMTVETGESAMILPMSVYEKLADPELQMVHLPSDSAKLSMYLVNRRQEKNPMVAVLRERIQALFCCDAGSTADRETSREELSI